MLRFQTAVASVLAPLLVVPVLFQGQIGSLADALAGTKRALEVLKGLEKRVQEEPETALALVLAATETPSGDEVERERRLEELRNEVNLLQMELDAAQSPMLAADGTVQSALGASEQGAPVRPAQAPAITTGLDDSMRALLMQESPTRAGREAPRGEKAPQTQTPAGAAAVENAYSADPLRHGITCYRAGRYAEALALLAPLEDGTALYWRARTLERLERLDDAVATMERALARGGDGFEARRAQTDLEFLRWKRDFVKSLPAGQPGKEPK